MKFMLLLLPSMIPVITAMCDHRTSHFKKRAIVAAPEFGYHGDNGPLVWHRLSEVNTACALGRHQSPIDIKTNNTIVRPTSNSSADRRTWSFSVERYPQGTELKNLGTTLEVVANGTLIDRNKTYSLLQFHFHTPSEHRINDEYYPLEVHFVFEAPDQSLAVVGVPMEISAESDPWISNCFKNVGNSTMGAGDASHTGPLDFTGLKAFVERSKIHQYSGSLTTPPCSEGVAWNVVGRPLNIDVATYRKVKKVMGYNARYTQSDPGEVNDLESSCMASMHH